MSAPHSSVRASASQAIIGRIPLAARTRNPAVSARQIASIFQSGGLDTLSVACLDTAQALPEEPARLLTAYHHAASALAAAAEAPANR